MSKSENKVATIQGFEIPRRLARQLTDDAIWILGHIKRRGAAYFETDDSLEDSQTVGQLRKIANEGYFHMTSNDDGHVHWIIDSDRFRVRK